MENYEFVAGADGTVIAKCGTNARTLTEYDRDIIEFLIGELKHKYPLTYKRLCNLYDRYKANRYHYDYRIVKRFIRCNMGVDDLLSLDIREGCMNIEFVACPLRGECCDENIICRPKRQSPLTDKLERVAELYAQGKTYKEIAARLGKSEKTVANQLRAIANILGLKRIKDIITYKYIYETQRF